MIDKKKIKKMVHFVEVVERASGKVVERIKCVSDRQADKVLAGVRINMDHAAFFARRV